MWLKIFECRKELLLVLLFILTLGVAILYVDFKVQKLEINSVANQAQIEGLVQREVAVILQQMNSEQQEFEDKDSGSKQKREGGLFSVPGFIEPAKSNQKTVKVFMLVGGGNAPTL